MRCETVKIEADTKQGFCIINKDDFDKEEHLLFEENVDLEPNKLKKKISKKAE